MSNYGKFSPIAKLKEKGKWPPYKPETEGWFKYLDEIVEILQKGYQAGGDRITPEHFAALNLFPRGIATGKNNAKIPTLPYYSDAQREFYDTYEDIKKTGENLLGLKTRGKGWTYDVAAISLFRTHFVDFSETIVLTPGGTSTAKTMFLKAYAMGENDLLSDFRWPKLKDTPEGKYIAQLKYGLEVERIDTESRQPTGEIKTIGPQSLMTVMVVTDPSVVRSMRGQLIIIEEMGEIGVEGDAWTAIDLIGVAQEVLREGGKTLGPIIAGGTSNQFGLGFRAFKHFLNNPKEGNFRKLWIPGNKSYWGFVDYQTGESDLEAAKEDILEKRKNLKDRALTIYKQEMALTEEEALFEGVNSVYPPEKCNIMINRIDSDKSISNAIQEGNLYCRRRGGQITKEDISFNIEKGGRFKKFKDPMPGLRYPMVMATDSYRLAQSGTSPSLGAMVGYVPFQGVNTPGDYPSFIYHARPEQKEIFFMDSLLACIYYDIENLIEYTDEDLVTFYRQHNALRYLKKRPRLKEGRYSKAENIYGIIPTEHNKAVALEYALEKFTTNWEDIYFIELFREFLKYGQENTDLAVTYNWAVMASVDNIRILDDYKKERPRASFSPYYVKKNGALRLVSSEEEAVKLGLIPQEAISNFSLSLQAAKNGRQ